MSAFVALLRGINVGGHNKLPMADLRELLEGLGCSQVATYIQSGNAVFRHSADEVVLGRDIPAAVRTSFGLSPTTLVLSGETYRQIAADNPYGSQPVDPKFIHVSFLAEPAVDADLDRLEQLRSSSEQFTLTDRALYFMAPNGIRDSKLAAGAERCLGVPSTSRNWRTVCKLVEMLEALD